MNASGTLRLDATDGPVELHVVDGGVACDGDAITVSFAAKPSVEDAWPPTAMFCLERAPLPQGGLRVGARFSSSFSARRHGWESPQLPKVHGYFTFHAMDVAVDFEVAAVRDDAVVFRFEATTEDTEYYDDRARPSSWRGECVLPRRPIGELWIPS